MTVQEYMDMTEALTTDYGVRPHAICADGYAISIQGGYGMHAIAKVGDETWEGIDFVLNRDLHGNKEVKPEWLCL